jgi:hypothetical protein
MGKVVTEVSTNGNEFRVSFDTEIKNSKILINKMNTKSLHAIVLKPDRVFKNNTLVLRYLKDLIKTNNIKINISKA